MERIKLEDTPYGWTWKGYRVYKVDLKTRKILPKRTEPDQSFLFRVFDSGDHLLAEESTLANVRKVLASADRAAEQNKT